MNSSRAAAIRSLRIISILRKVVRAYFVFYQSGRLATSTLAGRLDGQRSSALCMSGHSGCRKKKARVMALRGLFQ
jgi:hypothetical protein